MTLKLLGTLILILLLLVEPCYGQEVSWPMQVPHGLDDQTSYYLSQEYRELIKRRNILQKKISAFPLKCTGIKASNEALKSECMNLKHAIEAQWQRYEDDKEAYEASLRDKISSSVNALEARIRELIALIDQDKEQIKRLGFDSRAQDLEEWTRVAKEGKALIEDKVFKESISVVFGACQLALKSRASTSIKSLNPWNDDKLIKQIRSVGIDEPFLEEAIRKVASVNGKPEMLEALKECTKRLEQTWVIYGIGNELVKKPGKLEPIAQAIVSILKMVSQINPIAGLLLDDLTLLGPAMYFTSKANIERFTALNEQQLDILKGISDRLKAHMQGLKAAKKRLAALQPYR